MKKNFMLSFVLTLLFMFMITPVKAAESPFPNFDGSYQYMATLYGGWAGQQVWYTFRSDLVPDGEAGFILGFFDDLGLEPTAVYGWYRFTGDIVDVDPEDAQDYVLGVEFAPGRYDPVDILYPYLATERVRFSGSSQMDYGYVGLGGRWEPYEVFDLDLAFWYDATENYRITTQMNAIPHGALKITADVWCMIDEGDAWGYWRLQVFHPIDQKFDVIGVYEDSTRSDPIFLIGIGMEL